jgi:hypothetical protein
MNKKRAVTMFTRTARIRRCICLYVYIEYIFERLSRKAVLWRHVNLNVVLYDERKLYI